MEDTQNVPAVAPVATTPASTDQRSPSAARTFRISRGRPGGPGGNRGGAGGRGGSGGGRFGGGRGGRRDSRSDIPEQSDYEEKSIEIARVTRVTAGGKRMRFRALGIVGNRKGRVGFGIAKGVDVAAATSKAFTKARKSLITVPLVNETIPHEIRMKYCSAVILLKPAPKGTGVKAGGAVRQVLEIAGVPNITAKILGSSNKVNNVKATIDALRELRAPSKSVEAEHKSDVKASAE
jgi:small subunit ribosomal protein S5